MFIRVVQAQARVTNVLTTNLFPATRPHLYHRRLKGTRLRSTDEDDAPRGGGCGRKDGGSSEGQSREERKRFGMTGGNVQATP